MMISRREAPGVTFREQTRHPKVLIIGIDGATLDLIAPWTEEGKLPTFKRLLEEGAHGYLKSTFPPLTAAAWTSFMSGKNPGKHGLYDFIEPQPGSYDVRYTNARSRLARTVWQILSDAGMKVGVINVPMTYPPESVNGYMISGLDAPENSRSITYPPALYQELEKTFGRVSQTVRYLGYLNNNERREKVLRSLAEMDEHYLRVTQYLMRKHPVDVMMLVLTSTDSVQHFFWHCMDSNHPHHDPAAATFGNAILGAYQRIDRIIAKLAAGLEEDGIVILMSDHGFRPTSSRIVYLNRYLEQLGLLKLHEQEGRWHWPKVLLDRAITKGDYLLRSTLSPEQKGKVAQWFPRLRAKWEAHNAGLCSIDWAKTKAYCYETITCPSGIWINLKGLRPLGTVHPGPEYESLLHFITENLYALQDPLTGMRLVTKVYRKDEIYHGPYLDHAPDLTVAWWEGITFVGKPSFSGNGNRSGHIVNYTGDNPLAGGDWTGTHALNGMVLFKGKGFKRNVRLEGAEIIDIVPTLLYYLGLSGFEDMDGRVLAEAFEGGFGVRRDGVAEAGRVSAPVARSEQTYTDAEAAQIAERLRDLGYLEEER
jgi:predicted AlkP superfamily phosphohydrolase/phosphomutase